MFLPNIISGFILIAWASLSLAVGLLGVVCILRAVGRRRRSGPAMRVLLAAAACGLLVTAAMHNPLTIHFAQQARAAEMCQWQGRTRAEFEARYGPPDYWAGPFPSWRTLPWYSPLRWGSVTLAVAADGPICNVMVRGFREAFS
jgi:hypothetical protein